MLNFFSASPATVLYGLDLFGTAVFAISGALAAGRRHMDLFGMLVIAGVTAVGGGTVRDLLLNRHPVFWIADLTYLATIAGAATGTFLYTTILHPPRSALPVADAFGLAIFTVVGAKVAIGTGVHPVVVVLMGAMTGTVGGMIRDVLCGDPPLILRREIRDLRNGLVGGRYRIRPADPHLSPIQRLPLGPWASSFSCAWQPCGGACTFPRSASVPPLNRR